MKPIAVMFRSAAALAAGLISLAAAAGQPAAKAGTPPTVSPITLEEARAGTKVTLALVKDFMRIENTGTLVPSVEFERYTPVADAEQFVVGRWVTARTDGGTELPSEIVKGEEDPAGNIIQTIRLKPFPPKQAVTVTLTTLVARRERPSPDGPFPIPAPEAYPEEVRPYLATSPMVVVYHKVVQDTARDILAKTKDAYGVAAEICRLSKERTYLPSGRMDGSLPLSAMVIKHGGTCCASAVAAAAIFRACGIPAQITYCPPTSYVHGIVRFYLNGYGWVRMDATSGTGMLPLLSDAGALPLVRVFDTPYQMELQENAYAWPYQNNAATGPYRFRSGGKAITQVRMYQSGPKESPFVKEPFPHLEPGSWSATLGGERLEGPWERWDELVAASREALKSPATGAFPAVTGKLPGLAPYVDIAATWMTQPPEPASAR